MAEQDKGEKPSVGARFVESVNSLMASVGEEGRTHAASPKLLGPIFDETIADLQDKGKDLHAPWVMLATHLRVASDLKNKMEQWPSQYFVEESTINQLLGEISTFFKKHPELGDKYSNLEAL